MQKGIRRQQKQEGESRKRILLIALVLVLVIGGAFFAYMLYHRHQVQELLAADGIYRGARAKKKHWHNYSRHTVRKWKDRY